jgi:hypothetical protein
MGNLNPDGTLKAGVLPGTRGYTAGSLMDLIHQAGFTGAGAQTMYGIVMAESGGSATAHNTNAGTGDNSYGLAQINMLGSMGPARLREYGLTSNNQLFDPLTNLQVAFKLSGGGTHFGDWSTYNSGAYKQFSGQSGASVTNYSKDGSSGAPASGPALSSADYQQALGSLSGLLSGVPELKKILASAISGGWATSKFQQAIEQTTWYRQHNAATRELVAMSYSDPAEYKNRLARSADTVQTLARQMGVRLNSGQLATLAYQFVSQSWDSASLQHKLGYNYWNPEGALTGQAATYAQQLKQTYADYGVPISAEAVEGRVRQMLAGNQTLDTFKQNAIASAKSMYPSLAAQLDSGLTVKDIADPYKQQMGGLLEMDPNTIGVSDPLIKKALQGSVVNTGGKATATSTPLWQFEQTLRADPRWAKTNNARDTMSSALLKIGADFGFGPNG